MGDHFDPGDEFDGRDEAPLPGGIDVVQGGLFQYVDGARGQRIVGLEQFPPVRRGGNDENGHRHVGHDVFGSREPAHDGHYHVERDDIGPQCLAQLDRPLAVFRLSDHFESGIGGEDLAESAPDRQRVLDHENP
jgi:hypothetical protein